MPNKQTNEMKLAYDDQLEFCNFPERNGPAPIQSVGEVHDAFAALLCAQTQPQRIETCQKLITEAYAGHTFYLVSHPMRIEAAEASEPRFGREVLLRRDSIVEMILTALATVTEHREHGHRMRVELVTQGQ